MEFAKPIKMNEPQRFEGNLWEDFDTLWLTMHVYIKDLPERFPKDKRSIDWIGSLMDKYAVAWHIQWIMGTLSGLHPKSLPG